MPPPPQYIQAFHANLKRKQGFTLSLEPAFMLINLIKGLGKKPGEQVAETVPEPAQARVSMEIILDPEELAAVARLKAFFGVTLDKDLFLLGLKLLEKKVAALSSGRSRRRKTERPPESAKETEA